MDQINAVTSVGHAIQLAVAPVFLLSAIGAMLSVMTNRLSRVIDRARALEGQLGTFQGDAAAIHAELHTLSRRAKLANRSIMLCTVTALLVSAVIAVLFIGAFLSFNTAFTIAFLFIGAMIALFIGLLAFIREILLATASLRIGPH